MCEESSDSRTSLKATASGTKTGCSDSTSSELGGEDVSYEPTLHYTQEQKDIQKYLSETCKCSLGTEG